jgi:hypothetical protein
MNTIRRIRTVAGHEGLVIFAQPPTRDTLALAVRTIDRILTLWARPLPPEPAQRRLPGL